MKVEMDRLEIQWVIHCFIHDNGLAQVYAGQAYPSERNNRKVRCVNFCHARYLDGEVVIYGPKFITIKYKTAYRDAHPQDFRAFRDVQHALDFLQAAFVDFDFARAYQIPIIERKKKEE